MKYFLENQTLCHLHSHSLLLGLSLSVRDANQVTESEVLHGMAGSTHILVHLTWEGKKLNKPVRWKTTSHEQKDNHNNEGSKYENNIQSIL